MLEKCNQTPSSKRHNYQCLVTYDRNARVVRSVVDENFTPFDDVDLDAFLTINVMEIEDKYEQDQEE